MKQQENLAEYLQIYEKTKHILKSSSFLEYIIFWLQLQFCAAPSNCRMLVTESRPDSLTLDCLARDRRRFSRQILPTGPAGRPALQRCTFCLKIQRKSVVTQLRVCSTLAHCILQWCTCTLQHAVCCRKDTSTAAGSAAPPCRLMHPVYWTRGAFPVQSWVCSFRNNMKIMQGLRRPLTTDMGKVENLPPASVL